MEQVLQNAPKGKLSIKAVLASGGATTPVPGVEAHVHLFHDNRAFKEYKVLLDEHGAATLEDLPVVMGVVPLVRVEYKGLTYQEAGPPMDAANREDSVEVKVYDTTEEAPAWRILMRHVMAKPSATGVAVTEMVIVENPTDKTWLGKNPPDDKGNRPTVELTLPQGATDVTLESGFHGWCCTTYEGHELHIKMPMMPGQARFRFSYSVPAAQGASLITVASPVTVDHMMFLLPDDGTHISPAPDAADMAAMVSDEGGVKARMYQCDALRPGQAAGLLVSGAPTAPESAVSQAWPAQIWIFTGGGVALAALGGVLVWRRKRAGKSANRPKPALAG
jgi:MYXO-CTERM domain-containing protein